MWWMLEVICPLGAVGVACLLLVRLAKAFPSDLRVDPADCERK